MKFKIDIAWKIMITLIRNKYLISILAFVIWISVFDTYSLVDRYSNIIRLNSLKKEHYFFRQELLLYQQQYKELFSGKKELEKFAREQYLMKKENEDVFIIVFD